MFTKIKNDKALQQVVIYFLLVAVFLVQNNINLGGHEIYCKWDEMIPFLPIFIIAYVFWFVLIALTGFCFFCLSRIDLRKTFMSINICMAIGLIVYFFYPNYVSIRPEVYGDDIFSQAVKFLQEIDSSSSVCPSLHVAVNVSIYTGAIHSACFRNRRGIKIFLLLITILVSMSTVFIKQHSIIDVAFGVLVAMIAYVFVYKIYFNEKLR